METDDIFAAVAKIQSKSRKSEKDKFIEETVKYEKKVYDLEQLVTEEKTACVKKYSGARRVGYQLNK